MPRWVLHEHWASHHHFDFRIEVNGKLWSFAVPKGLPKKTGQKVLAIRTEDHALKWLNFEGVIPEGQYGAGRMKIVDKGTFDWVKKGGGRYVIVLKGKKYKGPYAIVPFNKEKQQYLIVKMKPLEKKEKKT